MHRMTPNWPWTANSDKHSAGTKDLPLRLKFYILLCDHWLSRYKVAPKAEIHWMTPNWTWTLNSQKYYIYTKYLPLRSTFSSVLLYNQRFSRYKVAENWKCTEWPQTELEHLTIKSTLYTINTHLWSPNFGPFRSMISHFRDTICTMSAKIGNAPNDPKLNLDIWQSILTPESQILVGFCLRPAVSKISHIL